MFIVVICMRKNGALVERYRYNLFFKKSNKRWKNLCESNLFLNPTFYVFFDFEFIILFKPNCKEE